MSSLEVVDSERQQFDAELGLVRTGPIATNG
jgi:hypothetical protein